MHFRQLINHCRKRLNNILCLDNNLILTTIKYLDWRVLNYVELARAYADIGALKAASKVITYGVGKVLYTKQVEE